MFLKITSGKGYCKTYLGDKGDQGIFCTQAENNERKNNVRWEH